MAHVHRQTYTQPIPAGAEEVVVKGRPLLRWRGRNREWVLAEPIPGKPGRCRVASRKWYVTYFDHALGRERTVPGYEDRAATDALMVRLVATSARVDSGLLPPEAARPRLTLSELLERWRQFVRHRGATELGAYRRWQRARDVVEGVGAARPADLTPSAVLAWVGAEAAARKWAAGSAVCYLSAAKGFTRWLAQVERAEPVDHLSGLPASFEGEVRRHRRALAPGQLEKLLDATANSIRTELGLSPAERHALYLVASSTGLRACELARLTAADLDEAAGQLTLRRPAKARGRREDVVPLDAEVVRLVKRACPKSGPLWPVRTTHSMRWWARGAAMIRRDLAEAGIPYRDSDRVFDFHCLRGQLATDLDRAGVTLQRAQRLMRHASPDMTARHYTRPGRDELAADAAKLGRAELAKKAAANLGANLGVKARGRVRKGAEPGTGVQAPGPKESPGKACKSAGKRGRKGRATGGG